MIWTCFLRCCEIGAYGNINKNFVYQIILSLKYLLDTFRYFSNLSVTYRMMLPVLTSWVKPIIFKSRFFYLFCIHCPGKRALLSMAAEWKQWDLSPKKFKYPKHQGELVNMFFPQKMKSLWKGNQLGCSEDLFQTKSPFLNLFSPAKSTAKFGILLKRFRFYAHVLRQLRDPWFNIF